MSACSGLHCAGCSGGAALPVLPLAAIFGVAWLAEHIVEVVCVSATCGALALAAVIALMRWTDRREARFGVMLAERRERLALPAPRTIPAHTAHTAHPQIAAGGNHLHLHFDGANPAEVAAILTRISRNGDTS